MAEPTRINAGDTLSWTRYESAYPASAGWTLTYYFSTGALKPVAVEATASGTDYAVTVPAATTAGWDPGTWRWIARVSKDGEVHTVGQGAFRVDPDPTAAVDRSTPAEKAVAAIRDALVSSAGNLVVEYELPDGVRVKKDRKAALEELDTWERRVKRERGLSRVGQIRVSLV